MKFNILINQKAAIDSGLDLDIIDLSIFVTLKDFALSKRCEKMKAEDGTVYYLFSWGLIVKELPILGLNSRQAVFKRFEKLRAANVIYPNPDNGTLAKSWYAFGVNYDRLIFSTPDNNGLQGDNESSKPANDSLQKPVNNGLQNNSTLIIEQDNKDTTQELIRKKKIQFCFDLIEWVKVNPSKYPKLMYVDFCRHWMETNKAGKKMRFEDEQFFELGKRLSTWFARIKDVELAKKWETENTLGTLNDLLKKNFINGTN